MNSICKTDKGAEKDGVLVTKQAEQTVNTGTETKKVETQKGRMILLGLRVEPLPPSCPAGETTGTA